MAILYHLRDKATLSEILVENRNLFIPPCIRCPVMGVPVGILPCREGVYAMVKKVLGYV